MTFLSFIRTSFVLSLITQVCFAITFNPTDYIAKDLIIQSNKIFDPNKLSVDSLQLYEQRFDFDWNNYATIEKNKNKIDEVEAFLKTHPDFSKLTDAEKQSLGKILYKMGTFYSHVMYQPNLAIDKLILAQNFLQHKADQNWDVIQLAYAYALKFMQLHDQKAKTQAYFYITKIIDGYHHFKNKEVAFALCVQGLMHQNEKNYGLAETSMRDAIKIYEHIPNGMNNDQYIRAKSRLAKIILDMNDRDKEALTLLQELQTYWLHKNNYDQNPYAARNLFLLAQAHFKLNDIKMARDEAEKTIMIYEKLYGKHSELLVKIYHLLSAAYKKLDNQKLANAFEERANKIEKHV